MPYVTSRRSLLCGRQHRRRRSQDRRRGRSTENTKQSLMLSAGCDLGGFDPGFRRIPARLSHRTRRCEKHKDEFPVHGNLSGILRYFEFGVLRDHFFEAIGDEADGELEVVTGTFRAKNSAVTILGVLYTCAERP